MGSEKKVILLFLKMVTEVDPKQVPKEMIRFILSSLKWLFFH